MLTALVPWQGRRGRAPGRYEPPTAGAQVAQPWAVRELQEQAADVLRLAAHRLRGLDARWVGGRFIAALERGRSGGVQLMAIQRRRHGLLPVAPEPPSCPRMLAEWRALVVHACADGKMPDWYSFGARQALAAHFANNTDPAVVVSSHLGAAYIPTLQASMFCLVPVGFGWAIRTSAAATYGCIPTVSLACRDRGF